MDVNIIELRGNWDLGYALDYHTIRSDYTGDDQWGHPTFHTVRSEAGDALYNLKYSYDQEQVKHICEQMKQSFGGVFSSADIIIPMPPSKDRRVQPVYEIAKGLGTCLGIRFCDDLLIKTSDTSQLKDVKKRNEKSRLLDGVFEIQDVLDAGTYNVLMVDDVFDTGASLRAATNTLRSFGKINKIYVAVVTRTK